MKQVTPHRKRQANKGRIFTGMVVTSGYKLVEDTHHALVWDSDVCKPEQASQRHGKQVDAILDERTAHRNRFNAEHRVLLIAPNNSPVRRLLKSIAHKGGKFTTHIQNGMVYVKVQSDAKAFLGFVNRSPIDFLFRVEEAFCGENKTPMASTVKKLHGRS